METKNMDRYPITRNRNEQGIILTYTVEDNKFNFEYNTLKEARLMAVKIEGFN